MRHTVEAAQAPTPPHLSSERPKVFQGIFEHRRIGTGAKLCYIRLLGFAGKDARCYPSLETLGKSRGVSDRQARNYVKKLERAGLIAAEQRGLRRINVYFFLWTAELEKLRHSVPEDSDDPGEPPKKLFSGERDSAPNAPLIQGISPSSGKAGTTFTVTITGVHLTGASRVLFINPSSLPGDGKGHGKGVEGSNSDSAFAVTNIQISGGGSQLTCCVDTSSAATADPRLVKVEAPSGDSSDNTSTANTFTVNREARGQAFQSSARPISSVTTA